MTFVNQKIYITRLTASQAVEMREKVMGESNNSPKRAKSSRVARNSNVRKAIVTSHDANVFTVKVQIYQSSMGLKCEPAKIRLFFQNKLLEDPTMTLEMAGIRAGDDVYYDTGGNEDDDVGSLSKSQKAPETGFSGTALMGSAGLASKSTVADGDEVIAIDDDAN